MKYKAIGCISCAVMLVISAMNLPLLLSANSGRYHQHIEAQEKLPCEHADEVFCTHLPLMLIDTGGVEIPGRSVKDEKGVRYITTTPDGSDRISAKMTVIDSEEYNNHITDTPTVTSDITIHVRGNSSRTFDKLGYRINLFDEKGNNNPQSLMGMNTHHEWVLHGPILDKTLMRNYMWYNIAGEIMDYAPNVRFCELFINGEYMGVYVLVENITAGKNGSRLNLTVDAKNNEFCGYLLLLDRYRSYSIEDDHLKSLTTYTLRNKHRLEIVYPGKSNLTEEIYEAIKEDFSAFEKALYSYDFNNEKYGYAEYIDVDSFVDYMLINEFTCNYDAGSLSTFMYKDINGKYQMCVWDFNSACDNYRHSYQNPNHFEFQNNLWFFMLLKDDDFVNHCIERYWELRESYFNIDYLYNYIDSVVDYLGSAIERNYEKWGYSFGEEYDLLSPIERNPRTYEEAIQNMKGFILERIAWMDENIETLKQYSAASRVKKFDENVN